MNYVYNKVAQKMNNIKCLPLSYTVFRVFTVLSLFSENTKEYGAWGSIVVKTLHY